MNSLPRIDPGALAKIVADDRPIVGKPLNLSENCVPALQANARHMALMLLDDPSPERASEVAAFAEALIDTTIAAGITAPLACGKGCAHCCATLRH